MGWGRAYGANKMHELWMTATRHLVALRRDHPEIVEQHPAEMKEIEELIHARRYVAAETLLKAIDPDFEAPATGKPD